VFHATIRQSALERLRALLERYGDTLWWLHSCWALFVGVCVMWVGSRHYELLRFAFVQIAFVWVAALIAPALATRVGPSRWPERVRLVLNYLSRNVYQTLLFFVLPVYFASASFSWNLLFVAFIALSALLSTLDVVYDRHLSVKRSLMAVFFAFNLFACINVMLPILWSISNAAAMRISAGLAVVAFATILFGRRGVVWRRAVPVILASAVILFALVEFARPLIPPAPLRVVNATFGLDLDRRDITIGTPLERLPSDSTGRVYVITAIQAPMGLEDRIAHRWYENGRLVWSSGFHDVLGGRKEGFRLWTSLAVAHVPAGRLRVDVVTEAGQLVGRCELPVEEGPPPANGDKAPARF
jgi:hypothetical protein